MFVDPLGGDLRVLAASPCIDTGDPSFEPEWAATDLDGHARVLCARVDMGVYEFGIGDFNCDRNVDLRDYGTWNDCVTEPQGGPYDDGCEAFDFEFDADVDLLDFGAFQTVFHHNP